MANAINKAYSHKGTLGPPRKPGRALDGLILRAFRSAQCYTFSLFFVKTGPV